jgi:glucose-6-phosphate isomerase
VKSVIWNQDALNVAEQAALTQMQAKIPAVSEQFAVWMQEKTLPMLHLPTRSDDLQPVLARAAHIRATAQRLIVLGTGGSSLGGQTLCSLSEDGFPVHFIDNVDPHTMQRYLKDELLRDAHLLLISKSGGTLETLTQGLLFLEKAAKLHGTQQLTDIATVITMPGARPLRALADHYALPVIDHDPDVGGRFSVLSPVGLLPAAVAGLDVAAIRRGAAKAMRQLQEDPQTALEAACWQAALMPSHPVSVMMPYCDRLRFFSAWYKQNWAESLGKGGKGSTPCDALGAVDQHSQLQLWLDGPKDKHFTVITADHPQGLPVPKPCFDGYDYLAGKELAEVLDALQGGTIETLKRHDLPLRVITLENVEEETAGELMMQFMIETIAAALLIEVNAFDQPAVEESKVIARETLKNGADKAA